jgi:hypothetical protein
MSDDYLTNIENYVSLFENFKLPYDLLIENDGIFKTSGSIFNFSPDIVKGNNTISNIYNTGNIHYYWTQLNSDIEKYRLSPRKSTTRQQTKKGNTRTTTRTKRRKSHSSLTTSTDFNILKKITKNIKINDDLLNQFTNDTEDNIDKYTFPEFIISQIRVLTTKIVKKTLWPFSKKLSSNNLLSSNSENSSSNINRNSSSRNSSSRNSRTINNEYIPGKIQDL